MQNMVEYNYKITLEQLEKACDIVRNITVIINGEYYELETSKQETKTKAGVIE